MLCCLTTKHFWQLKLCQPPTNDIILVGNSRVYLGLSPHHMSKACGKQKIFNFGFVACSLDRRYLEHAVSLLDMDSKKPTLVLGLCPHTLMPSSATNGYSYWSSQGHFERKDILRQILRDNLSGKALLKTNARNALNLSRGLPLNHYFADGWEACLPVHKQPEKYGQAAEKLVRLRQVNQHLVDEFLELVVEFHQRGIAVFAYRPPSDDRLREVEEDHSGLDYQDMADRFKQAGGVWLDINPQAYQTYDGAHLDYRNAIRLSQEVGRYLRNLI
ncbi:MAG: hypothetical protein L6288_16180 [Desulfarculaceae bacterium]|nr:hypothetical protein [Desulfarculaceae bacterium]